MTLNKSIKQVVNIGAVGDTSNWVSTQQRRNLRITSTTSTVTVTAGRLKLLDNYGKSVTVGVNVTIDITASGINGLDAGTKELSTWYYIYIIYNELTGEVGGLFSTSFYPILPYGFEFVRFVSVARYHAGGNFLTFYQIDNMYAYDELATVCDGTITAGAWTSIDCSYTIPPGNVTKRVMVVMSGTGNYSGISGNSDGLGNAILSLYYDSSGNTFGGALTSAHGPTHTGWVVCSKTDSTILYYYSESTTGIIQVQAFELDLELD